MKADSHEADSARELRLEGPGLVVVGVCFLALVAGAFYLGRWVERRSQPPARLAEAAADPLREVLEPTKRVDVTEGANYFDDLRGEQKALEPSREARTPGPAPVTSNGAVEPPREEPAPPAVGAHQVKTGGDFYVQVFAGRDRGSAEALVRELKAAGHGVVLLTEAEGEGTLCRVRVGGYPTEEAARQAALKLAQGGYSTWVISGGD